MLKLPYGISDYKSLIEEKYYYVDKTKYLEKLENVASIVTYLRPRRFGKTLFTSVLYYYYDLNSRNLFDSLFKNTYVYNNPTVGKNNYYILKFDFSGISMGSLEELENSFNKNVIVSIKKFISQYNLSIDIELNQSANDYIREFFFLFSKLNLKNKIYLIIDEYDNFTNSILENVNHFKNITSDNSFLKSFYQEVKKACGDVVDKVFITGVCSITLDSMTSGFNVSTNLTNDFRFNSMVGLTHSEVKELINRIETNKSKQREIYDILIENYDGYLFNNKLNEEDKVFNVTLVMNFLNYYNDTRCYPDNLTDTNIVSSYRRIENILTIQNNNYYKEIINDILDNNRVEGNIIANFDLSSKFTKNHIISLLYYFGYLSIDKSGILGTTVFKVPNKIILNLYVDYFRDILIDTVNLDNDYLKECRKEIIFKGKIDKISNYVSKLLKESENRIFKKFDEKYIQMMYFTLLSVQNNEYSVYNEYFSNGGYTDLFIKSKSKLCKYNVMIELKYIKKEDYNDKLLKEKQVEATFQIKQYINDKRMNNLNTKKYIVLFVKDEIKLLKEV